MHSQDKMYEHNTFDDMNVQMMLFACKNVMEGTMSCSYNRCMQTLQYLRI